MNWRITLSVFVVAATLLSGCNKAKELLDVKFNTEFSVDLPVNVSGGRSIDGSFFVEETIDPLADEEVEKYIDNIKSFEITEIKGIFHQVDPDFDLSGGLVKVSSDSKEASWSLPVQEITNGSVVTLDDQNGQWQTTNDILGEKQPFTVHFSGTTSGEEDFVLQVIIKTKITANPL